METDIQKALDVLRSGGVILYPTDTVWGLGCDASNHEAIDKIFSIKKRAEAKSLIVLVSDVNMLHQYVSDLPEVALELIENSIRPLTIVYDAVEGINSSAKATDGSVGIRVVNDDFCKQLINKFGKPIVSTSANLSNKATPLNFNEIDLEIKNQVDYIVSWRKNETIKSQPSSIIRLASNGEVEIIRK